jgi:peptidoglycan hydrolase CwlO-like protein
MMDIDWQVVGTAVGSAIVGIGGGVSVAWGFIQKARKDVADTKADVAQSKAEQVAADAQGTIYTMLKEQVASLQQRLDSQEKKIHDLQTSLIARDQRIAILEGHIYNLENSMRAHGLEPPRLVTLPAAPVVPSP